MPGMAEQRPFSVLSLPYRSGSISAIAYQLMGGATLPTRQPHLSPIPKTPARLQPETRMNPWW